MKKVFDEETVKEELAKLLEVNVEDIEEIEENKDWEAPYYTVTIGDQEYMVTEDIDDAETIAQAIVKQDLEEEPELFNQDWLKGTMNTRLSGQSFIEHAAEEAVNVDGFSHFLASYDGDYQETESGFVVMRVN